MGGVEADEKKGGNTRSDYFGTFVSVEMKTEAGRKERRKEEEPEERKVE